MKKKRRLRKSVVLLAVIGLVIFAFYRFVYPLYPSMYKDYIEHYSKEYNIDKALLYSVMLAESSFREDVSSHKESRGLMQISQMTGEWAAQVLEIPNYSNESLYEPKINIQIGCWYLRKLIDQYGEVSVALAAYNAGSGNVSKWLNDSRYSIDGRTLSVIPYKETNNYVNKISKYVPFYQYLINFSKLLDFK